MCIASKAMIVNLFESAQCLQSKYSFRTCENVWPQALSSLQLGSINNIINGDKFALFVMQLGDFILITVLWS